MMKSFVSVLLLCITPLLYLSYKRYKDSKDPSGFYGDRMGVVRILKITDQGSGKKVIEDEGPAVLRIHLYPNYFSFLDRYKSDSSMVDAHGIVRTVNPVRARTWALRWNAGASRLMVPASPDSWLTGDWNGSYTELHWSFARFNNSSLTEDMTYEVRGKLVPGDAVTFGQLQQQIRNP
jgi:hypothetical protein